MPNVGTGDLAPDGQHWFTQDEDQFAVSDIGTYGNVAVPVGQAIGSD